jgi:lipopolysaccharide transport system permease protein
MIIGRVARERRLVWALIRRDVSSRFAGSRLGFFWSLANPAIQLASYGIIFGVIYGGGQHPGRGEAATLVPALFCGLWPWWAFSDGTIRGYAALVDQSALLKRFVIPIEVCVVAAATSAFMLQIVGFGLFLLIFSLLGVLTPQAGWLLLPGVVFAELILVTSLALVLAPLYLVVRDTGYVASAGLTIGFFVSPVLFSFDDLPHWLRLLTMLNPMSALIGLYRSLVLGQAWPPLVSLGVLVVTIGALFHFAGRLLARLDGVLDEYW